MEKSNFSRRELLQTAAVAATALAAGELFSASGKEAPKEDKKGIFVCSACDHVEFGKAPEICPVCHAPKKSFKRNDDLFAEAEKKFEDLAPKHIPVISVEKQSALITEEPCAAVTTRIGKVLHPMEAAHHIKFIDWYVNDAYVCRSMLTTGVYAAASLAVKVAGSKVRIVELCNLHGYWQSEAEIA